MQVHSRVGRNDPVPAAVAEPPFRLRLLTRAAVKTDLGRCEGSRILGSSQGSRKRRFSESRGGHNKLSVAGSSIPPKTPRPCRLRLRRRRGRPHLALPCPPTLTRLSMERVLRPGRGHTCIRPWLTRRLVLCARACVRACVRAHIRECMWLQWDTAPGIAGASPRPRRPHLPGDAPEPGITKSAVTNIQSEVTN